VKFWFDSNLYRGILSLGFGGFRGCSVTLSVESVMVCNCQHFLQKVFLSNTNATSSFHVSCTMYCNTLQYTATHCNTHTTQKIFFSNTNATSSLHVSCTERERGREREREHNVLACPSQNETYKRPLSGKEPYHV